MIDDPRRQAPDYLVQAVADNCPRPTPGPDGQPTADQWALHIRGLVDVVWAAAWYAGVAHGLSLQHAQPEAGDSLNRRLAGSVPPPINLGGSPPATS
jgi:hypothetical protein